ncbi:YIP1 family protein [bacterium SCSIO 12696]|nr:YIP1 family protein [bacterium SCSIO 12696]
MDNIYQSPESELIEQKTPEYKPTDYNPWLSIWLKPHATMRQILATDPNKSVFMLVILGGFANTFSNANEGQIPYGFIGLVITALIGGAIIGFIFWLLYSSLINITGRWLGGQGNWEEVRCAVAWANVPLIWMLVVEVPFYLLFNQLPTHNEYIYYGLLYGTALVLLVVSIWSVFTFCHCVGEAHKFSAWKALGSTLISLVLILGPVIGLILLFS